ncbi:MAG: hypothetical protein EXR91_03915 [Gemmatimonadetes bacterium]|nr:hypothetical protein [Gemmatimonadota bacterium]
MPYTEFIGAVADALDGLDFAKRADEVREWESKKGSPDVVTDAEALAIACLKAAVRPNEPLTAEEAKGSAEARPKA